MNRNRRPTYYSANEKQEQKEVKNATNNQIEKSNGIKAEPNGLPFCSSLKFNKPYNKSSHSSSVPFRGNFLRIFVSFSCVFKFFIVLLECYANIIERLEVGTDPFPISSFLSTFKEEKVIIWHGYESYQ